MGTVVVALAEAARGAGVAAAEGAGVVGTVVVVAAGVTVALPPAWDFLSPADGQSPLSLTKGQSQLLEHDSGWGTVVAGRVEGAEVVGAVAVALAGVTAASPP